MNRQCIILLVATLCVLRAAAVVTEPMTLEDCTDYAQQHSRELAQLRLALENQELTTRIERGKFIPNFSLSGETQLDDSEDTANASLRQELPAGITATVSGRVTEDAENDENDNASLSIRVSKQLLGAGSWRESMLDIDNSLLSEIINRNRLHRYERELVYGVKQSFYSLIQNYQTLRINEMRLERAKKNLEHAIERQRPLDIETARIEVPENEAGVLRARRQIQSSLDSLKELIGMDVAAELEVDTTFTFAARDLQLDSDLDFALQNHEDILNAELQRRQKENEYPVQRRRQWPTLTLSATTEQEGDEGINLDGDPETKLGLGLSWDLGGSTERLKTRRLARQIASEEIGIEDLKQARVRSLRDFARRIGETRRLVELQEVKIKVAERRSELYADRWQNGEIDILEYIRSQNDLENSRIQLINLQTTYMDLLGEYEFNVGR